MRASMREVIEIVSWCLPPRVKTKKLRPGLTCASAPSATRPSGASGRRSRAGCGRSAAAPRSARPARPTGRRRSELAVDAPGRARAATEADAGSAGCGSSPRSMSTAGVDLARQSTAASSTRPTCLRFLGREARSITSCGDVGHRLGCGAKVSAAGTGDGEDRLELLDQQVVVELASAAGPSATRRAPAAACRRSPSAPPRASRSASCLRSGPSSAAAAASGTSCGTPASPWAARS